MLVVSNSQIEGKKLAEKLGGTFCHVDEKEYPDTERAHIVGDHAGQSAGVIYFVFNRSRSFDDQLFGLLCVAEQFADPAATRLVLPYLPYCRSFPSPAHEIDKLAFVLKELDKRVKEIFVVTPHVSVEKIKTHLPRGNAFLIDIDDDVADYLKTLGGDLMLVSPDKGFAETVKRLSKKSGIDYVVLAKKRVSPTTVETAADDATTEKILKNKNKRFVILDDIVSTGNTLVKTAAYLRSRGVEDVACVTIHNTCPDAVQRDIKVHSSNSLVGAHTTAFDITESVCRALRARS